MNRMALHFRLYLKNWQLLLLAFFPGVALTAPAIFARYRVGEPHLMLTLLGVAGLVCSTAFWLGTAQQELLSRSFSFLLPGLRRGMVRQNLLVVGLMAALVFAAGLALPVFAVAGHAAITLAWGLACLAILVYSLLLLVITATPFSSWLPFQAFWFAFLLIKLLVDITPGDAAAVLDLPLLWTPLSAAALATAMSRLGGSGLHRRLVEQPFISITDLKSSDRMEAFKHARRRHKNSLEGENRPGGAVIRWCLERSAQAVARAQHTRALVWEANATMFMIGIPRRRTWHVFLVVLILTFIVWLGYWDAWIGRDPDDTDLVGWFPGLVFMSVFFSLPAFHFLKTRPLGMLRGRQALYRAGFLGALHSLVQTTVLAWVLFGIFQVGVWLLPAVEFRGCVLHFQAPAWHLPLLPFFFLPLQFLVHTLWRNKGSMQVMNQAGTMAFFLFHALLTFSQGALLWPAAGGAVLLWLVWAAAWRWRILQTDLA